MRRSLVIYLTLLFCIFLLTVPPAPAQVLAADTMVSSTYPTGRYGSATSLQVTASTEVYLHFIFDPLPAGTTGSDVAKATLTLYPNSVSGVGAFKLYRNLIHFDELTADYTLLHPVIRSDIDLLVGPLTVVAADANHAITLDVTPAVKDWLDGTLPNEGFALVPADATINVRFDSKESTTTSHEPRLDVRLKGPKGDTGLQGPQGPPGVDGAQGPQGIQGPAGVLASFDSMSGLSCTRNGFAGTVSVSYATNGAATLRCVLPPSLTADAYEPNDTFDTAFNLGSISGDTGMDVVTVNANLHLSTDVDWYRFNLNENDNSIFTAIYLSANVDLYNMPASSDYDLYVYNASGIEIASSVQGGNATDSVCVRKNDDWLANDSRVVYVKVKPYVWNSSNTSYTLQMIGNVTCSTANLD